LRLQFGHGTDAVEASWRLIYGSGYNECFNSATALTPWRTQHHGRRVPAAKALQFGHGTDAVEDEAVF
jgi:hypothetical protein